MPHDTPIERFARFVLEKPLYPYQAQAANAIIHSIDNNLGWIITVMMSRQAGKNQLSAVLEAFLLFTREKGTIIKAAPTFHPQVIASRRRLMSMLETPILSGRVWTSYATIGLAPSADPGQVKRHVGPSVMFFSADPESNVVGATADILLEIDEAQDVTPEKFNRDFRPMAATTNSTTVLYGTAWSADTLLAQQRALNLELEREGKGRRHFQFDWRHVATCNPRYKQFVEAEIERLGEDHRAIQTQYYLRPISGAGFFFNDLQRQLLRGKHMWEDEPRQEAGAIYVAGLDIGGEERPDPDKPGDINVKRDSTVLTIARVQYNELNVACLEVVHQAWSTGMHYLDQYAALQMLIELWDIRKLAVDNTGQGAGLASMLVEKYGDERVELFTFTRPSKSRLGYQLLAQINSGRTRLYAESEAPRDIHEQMWQQIKMARYSLPAPETINFYVEPQDGHDDFLISLALCAQALHALLLPAHSEIIKPPRSYEGESRY